MKIIVLCPVKNEAWILKDFLDLTSRFADHIIIADQMSTDGSRELAEANPKTIVIDNTSSSFNEADRQMLLIDEARRRFGIGNFLLAIDADELITADSLESGDWGIIKASKPGTVFKFDKPTPIFNIPKALRYEEGFPLGFKDDGSKHVPKKIHSNRVPFPKDATVVTLPNIKFLHLCFAREKLAFSKNRYYCVLENLHNTKSLRNRRLFYSKLKPKDYLSGHSAPIDPIWLEHNGVRLPDIHSVKEEEFNNYDYEVLRHFEEHNTSRFFNDQIWDFDWEACRLYAISHNITGVPKEPIKRPSKVQKGIVDLWFNLQNAGVKAFRKIKKKIR